jgi:hypothetical protein
MAAVTWQLGRASLMGPAHGFTARCPGFAAAFQSERHLAGLWRGAGRAAPDDLVVKSEIKLHLPIRIDSNLRSECHF